MTERIDAFLHRLERMNIDDLGVLVIAPPSVDQRDALLSRIDAAAAAAGRLDEIDEAADRAADAIVRSLSFRSFNPTWLGMSWAHSPGRAEDRALLIQAVEDAAIAAVVADLAPDEAAGLAEPFEILAAMGGTGPAATVTAHPRDRRRMLMLVGAALVALWATTTQISDLAGEIVRHMYDGRPLF